MSDVHNMYMVVSHRVEGSGARATEVGVSKVIDDDVVDTVFYESVESSESKTPPSTARPYLSHVNNSQSIFLSIILKPHIPPSHSQGKQVLLCV